MRTTKILWTSLPGEIDRLIHSLKPDRKPSRKTRRLEVDAVIHTGLIHDFSTFAENCEIDRSACRSKTSLTNCDGTILGLDKRGLCIRVDLQLLITGETGTEKGGLQMALAALITGVSAGLWQISSPGLAFMFWSLAAMRNAARERLKKSAPREAKWISFRPTFETPRVLAPWRRKRSNSETTMSIF